LFNDALLRHKIRKGKGDDDLDGAGVGYDVMCHIGHTTVNGTGLVLWKRRFICLVK